MKKFICAISILTLASFAAIAQTGTENTDAGQTTATSDGLNWLENHAEALALAKKENKPLLIDFTGSDWCGWCIRLKKEVINTPEFEKFAKENLILQVADFPRNKPQSAQLKKANRELAEKYGIQGFPTLIILNPDGQQIGQMGYMRGGPKPFIAKLKKTIDK